MRWFYPVSTVSPLKGYDVVNSQNSSHQKARRIDINLMSVCLVQKDSLEEESH